MSYDAGISDPVHDTIVSGAGALGEFVGMLIVTAIISAVFGGVGMLVARIASESYWRSKLQPKLMPTDDADLVHAGNRKAWALAAVLPVIASAIWLVLLANEHHLLAGVLTAPVIYFLCQFLVSKFSAPLWFGDESLRAAAEVNRRKMDLQRVFR